MSDAIEVTNVTLPVYADLPADVREEIENAVNQRSKVEALIRCNMFTKVEMSSLLGITTQSISSQMSYLRLSGVFIKYDENRVYSLCTEEEYKEWAESRETSAKGKGSTKSPVEQANGLAKSIQRQTTQKMKLDARVPELQGLYEADTDNQFHADNFSEAAAKIVLLEIGIRRAEIKLAALNASIEASGTVYDTLVSDTDIDIDIENDGENDGDDLL